MFTDLKLLSTPGQQIASSVAAVYTAPAGKAAQIGEIRYHNTNIITENVEFYIGGSADNYKALNISLAGNETFEDAPKLPICLVGGESIYCKTTTAGKVNIFVYGHVEI